MSSGHEDASREQVEHEADGRTAAPPDDPGLGADLVGRVVAGRYTIEALLGSGATGRTFRARRDQDGALVALKVAHASLRDDEKFKRRLARDAEAAAKLEHMHVAQVFEHGVDDEHGPFVCRELLDGEDLVSAARRGVLSPRRLCELMMQTLSALSEAHRQGVLHRNLKPQNVIVVRDTDGRECAKVCDFGRPRRDRSWPEYLAPESDGPAVDGRVDVYAVGVMLYELLVGEVPFRAGSVDETLALHKNAPVPAPYEKAPERHLPRELEAVCLKALAKDPGQRHPSPRAMSQALRAVVSLLDVHADEPIGSGVFADGREPGPTASVERMTMPGEQLRSSTKFWLGAGLLAAVCLAVLINPDEDDLDRARGSAVIGNPEQRDRGAHALDNGLARLHAGDAEGAVLELRNAHKALGDAPEVLRALGEALVIEGTHREEGAAMLSRYLELKPEARDRKFVERLVRIGEHQR